MTVSAINSPVFSYPAAPGGKLHTYAAGGTTPQATYSDAAGSVPNINPVTLDTNGNATVRGNGAYHLVLKDATDTTTIIDFDSDLCGVAQTTYCTDTGALNAIAFTNAAVPLLTGIRAQVVIGHTNTSTAVTVNANASGAITLLCNNGAVPAIGQLIATQIADIQYNGTNWLLLNLWPIIDSGANAVTIPGPTTINGSASTPTNAIGNSGTAFTLDCSKSNVHSVTLTGSVATMTVSNPSDGQTINLFITQGSGPYTFAWPASFKWPGGSAGAVSVANGAVDLLVATYRASTGFFYVTLTKAFA